MIELAVASKLLQVRNLALDALHKVIKANVRNCVIMIKAGGIPKFLSVVSIALVNHDRAEDFIVSFGVNDLGVDDIFACVEKVLYLLQTMAILTQLHYTYVASNLI